MNTTTTDYARQLAATGARMRQAVEESGLGLETIAEGSGIPVDELRDKVLNGTGELIIQDLYCVSVCLGLESSVWSRWLDPVDEPEAARA
ncbi:hypothetical protein [Nocardioides sp.]|jgi:hypothetical protein|uniref:hypothetical protein n=1 Tax=Nocardioides sp. TaxID=35761 RepID=UPI002F423410